MDPLVPNEIIKSTVPLSQRQVVDPLVPNEIIKSTVPLSQRQVVDPLVPNVTIKSTVPLSRRQVVDLLVPNETIKSTVPSQSASSRGPSCSKCDYKVYCTLSVSVKSWTLLFQMILL